MMTITATTLVAIFCAIVNCTIGIYVLRKDSRSVTHRAFFLVVMPVAFWALALALAHSATTPTIWYVRLSFATGSLLQLPTLPTRHRPQRHRTRRCGVNRRVHDHR